MSFERSSGILLHPTSLPGGHGIGTLGKEAFDFIDFLVSSGQKLWQIFPLGPTGYGDSPYQCFSAFAGNPLLISLDLLKDAGFLQDNDLEKTETRDENRVDFGKVIQEKFPVLKAAYSNFKNLNDPKNSKEFDAFCRKNSEWLDDYSLFAALKEYFGGKAWIEWDQNIKLRRKEALNYYKTLLSQEIRFFQFLQYLFFQQWSAVKSYANSKGISIIGDIPIYIAFDSADAWANPELFYFDQDRKPVKVAGVPPDYFSVTGQLWGNPLYNWKKLKKTGYAWWKKRFQANLKLVDILRLDHFRGFAAFWAVPFGNKTAENGTWEKGPGLKLFQSIEKSLGKLPIIAEDLGFITPDVDAMRDALNYPGMKILQFAFGSDNSPDMPHRYVFNSVAYTGTHDNDTTVGWFSKLKDDEKKRALDYLNSDGKNISWDLIRGVWSSTSDIAIAPLQDVLSLGSEARMNLPGTAGGNWQWRFKKGQLNPDISKKLKDLTQTYQR